jgi:hypothetical protein
MNPDFVDLLRAFADADVRFMIVGAYALAVHGRPPSQRLRRLVELTRFAERLQHAGKNPSSP